MGADNFLNWLSGFTDGEGTFYIEHRTHLRNPKVGFVFKITLHIDDIETLNRIKFELSRLAGTTVGDVKPDFTYGSATYRVHNFKIIRALLIPIFQAYPLRTAKYFDFMKWVSAIEIKSNGTIVRGETNLNAAAYNLSLDQINKIGELKRTMNNTSTVVDLELLPKGEIHPYWLLGFTEAEGSFTSQVKKNFSPRFSIVQHIQSEHILTYIETFLKNLPFKLPNNLSFSEAALHKAEKGYMAHEVKKSISNIYGSNSRQTELQLLISSQPFLFYQILAFFESMEFISRKGVDFQIWAITMRLKLAGYHKIELGADIMARMINNMNSARYSNYDQYKKNINNTAQVRLNASMPTCAEINSLLSVTKRSTGIEIVEPFKIPGIK